MTPPATVQFSDVLQSGFQRDLIGRMLIDDVGWDYLRVSSRRLEHVSCVAL